jgi:predicted enzyme related to lactoylglutathione lyase
MKNPIVHFEIPADNVERAMKFYQETFGWEINTYEMPEGSATGGDPYYGIRTVEVDENDMPKEPGGINGGLMKRKMPGQPFMNYIQVDSIDEMLKVIKTNGGDIKLPKMEIAPTMGWIAAFMDTEGNMMGLHELAPEFKKKLENKKVVS